LSVYSDQAPSPVAAVVILAAGEGKRMKSSRSKLLHQIAGHSMLSYAVTAATTVQPEHIVVVVGHLRDQVEAHLAEIAPHVLIAVQEQQLGTGHAVQAALAQLADLTGDVIVTLGDAPMLTGETLAALLDEHRTNQAAVTVLTAEVPDPTGYGRILRDTGGMVTGIVEHRDADDSQLEIIEINSGIYVFDAATLRSALTELAPSNDQGELYLTDVLSVVREAGKPVSAYVIDDVWQAEGVNDRIQLCRMNAELNRRILQRWMSEGVTVVDPATTWVHASVDLAPDVILLPGTSLEGATSVAAGALIDVEVGENAVVTRTQASLSVIGRGASVGPFAHLRPGTTLGAGGKIGTFVETKNARIGAGAKAPHLSYLGDAVIAEGANIGAGVIFANYDGVRKSTSTVGAYSFVGSNSVLVAPVEVADGAYVAAGSTITGNVGPGDLAVSRSQQRNVPGWVARKRPETKTARAAEAAQEQRAAEAAQQQKEPS
jgi:bifunctional UDP-N-acetylglucosamine pyrophosphorylase/glucosamine-1-phosphate N-acetyltransferase